MFIGYIVNDSHPCLKTITESEIEKYANDKPILIVGFDKAYELYPSITLENKVVDQSKQIFYSFSFQEAEDKYKENLKNFLNHCFQLFISSYKVIPIVNIFDFKQIKGDIFYYETPTLITITSSNKIYYFNKEIINFFNSDSLNLLLEKLEDANIISWEKFTFIQSYLKANNCYKSKEQIKLEYANIGDIDLYLGALCLDSLTGLNLANKSINTWQRAYEVETYLSSLPIKVNEELLKNLASDEENTVAQSIYSNLNKSYIVQKYNGTDKITGRMFATKSGFSVQTLPPNMRNIVIAEKNCLLVEFDYQYFEYTLLSQLCKFSLTADPHLALSQLLFNDSNHRVIGKEINYSLLYGKSITTLLKDLYKQFEINIPEQELKEKLLEVIKPMEELKQRLTQEFEANGFILNYFNRNIVPEKNYTCLNNYIQSTAADFFIIKLLKIRDLLKKYSSQNQIILQNHDSILLNLTIDEIENTDLVQDIFAILREQENNLVAEVDMKYGINWGNLK